MQIRHLYSVIVFCIASIYISLCFVPCSHIDIIVPTYLWNSVWCATQQLAWQHALARVLLMYVLCESKYVNTHAVRPGLLCTIQTDVLPQDLVESRSRDIRVQTFPISLKSDRHLGGSAAEMPVYFQSDTINITPNPVASRLYEIWR